MVYFSYYEANITSLLSYYGQTSQVYIVERAPATRTGAQAQSARTNYVSGSSVLISSVIRKPAKPITTSMALLVFSDSISVSPVMVR